MVAGGRSRLRQSGASCWGSPVLLFGTLSDRSGTRKETAACLSHKGYQVRIRKQAACVGLTPTLRGVQNTIYSFKHLYLYKHDDDVK